MDFAAAFENVDIHHEGKISYTEFLACTLIAFGCVQSAPIWEDHLNSMTRSGVSELQHLDRKHIEWKP